MPRRTVFVCGHYGSGKTTFSLNLALRLTREGQKVTLADLDVVNPYFRSSDYTALLESQGVRVIAPVFAGTTLDVPALSPRIGGAFDAEDGVILADAGGDDAGAAALGAWAARLPATAYEMLYVINRYRGRIRRPEDAARILREIEEKARLKATALVHNSHLAGLTAAEDVLMSLPYAEEVAGLTGLPIAYTAVPAALYAELKEKAPNPFPVETIVKPNW